MDIRTAAIAAKNLLTGGNLRSLAMNPREAVYYSGECLFLDRVMHANGDLPQKHVWDAFGVSADLAVTICPDAAAEWFRSVASYSADLVELCALARILNPTTIFEIGTYHGSGAIHLAANAPNADIYTLDLGPSESPSLSQTAVDRQHVEDRKVRNLGNRIHLLYGDSATFDFSLGPSESPSLSQTAVDRQHVEDRKVRNLGNRIHLLYGDSATFDFSQFRGNVDLFFIDGAHSYEYVRNDTLKASECIHQGSVIAWHDYGRCGVNGVSRWLNEFREGREIYRIPGGSLAYMIAR